jgi:hypothetical protein
LRLGAKNSFFEAQVLGMLVGPVKAVRWVRHSAAGKVPEFGQVAEVHRHPEKGSLCTCARRDQTRLTETIKHQRH